MELAVAQCLKITRNVSFVFSILAFLAFVSTQIVTVARFVLNIEMRLFL